ncbi:melanoma antigen preferentially expressed in tumors-like [Tenrec ecaudatus]|uniref:melanoma antigen preferentially expressed in tumors-like n=1 Tax=Tenrec ecaudatus TaxID=94439 RepID=UPI003F5ACB4E
MGSRSPPSLLDLAIQSALQSEGLAAEALEWLPSELFLPVFRAAVAGRHRGTIKAMVAEWPFPQLPLGALLKGGQSPHEILKAALDGLAALLSQGAPRRRCDLKVLDLRLNVDTLFWKGRTGTGCSDLVPTVEEREATQPPARAPNRVGLTGVQPHPLWVLTDLCFQEKVPDEFLTFLTDRVKQRKPLPHLRCRKLLFMGDVPPLAILGEILSVLQLDAVQELKIQGFWGLQDLTVLSPYLARMVHLHTLLLSKCLLNCLTSRKKCRRRVQELFPQLSSPFHSLTELQHLTLDSVSFLKTQLHCLLTCVQTPLETLCLRRCRIHCYDLANLASYPCTRHLRSLVLSGEQKSGFCYGFLPALLHRVSATLESLDLANYGLTDASLFPVLPALYACSRLSRLMLCGNPLSMGVLEHLLPHCIAGCRLSFVHLPVPLDCFVSHRQTLDREFLEEVMEDLRQILQPYRLKAIRFIDSNSFTPCNAICILLDN